MEKRIYGLETEYGITCAAPEGPPPLDAEEAARQLFDPLVQRTRSTNVFLENGGRLYLDVGAHPEYATAECDNLWDLLAQDRAGADILAEMASAATAELAQRGVAGRIHLLRNNFDYEGNSFGCHENYLLRRRRDFREVADALVAYFVTRQIVTGSGDVKSDADGTARYCFSARADQMWDAVSAATTRSRPIINTRDEPLADAGSYRRMHVIVGDSNIAEPTTALKVGATELLLAAVDRGMQLSDLALADPIAAIRAITFDTAGELLLPMADGSQQTAVQLQREVRARVLRTIPEEELTDLQLYLVDLWGRALDAVESGDWSGIETEIDFAIKKKLLDQYVARSGADLDDPRVRRLLLSYHDVTDAGLRPRLEAAGAMARLTSQPQVASAVSVPPPTTRASLRGRVISAARRHRRDLGADWVHLRLEDGAHKVSLQDPFASEDPRVDDLVDVIERTSAPLPA